MTHRVLFSHSYFLRFDPKQWAQGKPYAPLGTLYAAALLRDSGYEVELFDTMFCRAPQEISAPLQKHQPDIFVLCDDGFNYLTKMCLTNMREAAFVMMKLAKAAGCRVVVSSSDSTDRFSEYLSEGADFVILGEPEQTLLELADHLTMGDDSCETIAGIAFTNGDRVVRNKPRPVLKDLDALPDPAWDLVDLAPYREAWKKSSGYFSMNMNTTRGCPFKCNWCAKPIYGNRYNSRSPERVVNEIKLLTRHFGAEHIWFCDDIFGLKPGWVARFSELMQKEQLTVRFKIQSRADLLSEEDAVRLLATAGCETVWIGAESGSQKVLDAMDKGITLQQIRGATEQMKRYGISPCFFIQFGYPGENREDIARTISMITGLLPDQIGISVSYPLPGTPFYDRVRSELLQKSNWTDSDEMVLMFTNTFPPAFYKQLHQYVHRNHLLHLARRHFQGWLKKPAGRSKQELKKALSLFYHGPATWLAAARLQRLEKTTLTRG